MLNTKYTTTTTTTVYLHDICRYVFPKVLPQWAIWAPIEERGKEGCQNSDDPGSVTAIRGV